MTPRILRSKLAAPRVRDDVVARGRIDELLSPSAAAWLVSAGAGYGKTTAVALAARVHDVDRAWLRVDAGDNDPTRFFGHLLALVLEDPEDADEALQQVGAEIEGLFDASVQAIERRVERSGALLLVLDDLHEVSSPEVLELLTRLLSHLPHGLVLAMVTRTDPRLPIGRLRAQGLLAEVRAPDLAFTAEETAELLVGVANAAELRDRTEGWPTGLAMLAMASGDVASPEQLLDAAASSDLGDFLASEVLARQPEGIRQFLVETSVLDELCAASCSAVTGRDDARTLLRDLHRRQVFTELVDADAEIYRYHALFRAFLERRAEELPARRLAEVHRRAASWFDSVDMPSGVIHHAMCAGDDDLALATIRTWFGPYAQMGLLATGYRWLERYGIDRCRAVPDLRTAAAWALLNIRRYDEAADWAADEADEQHGLAYRMQMHAVRSHLHRHLGRFDLARHEAALAVDDALRAVDGDLDCSFAHAVGLMMDQLDGRADADRLAAAIEQGEPAGNESAVYAARATAALAASLDPATHALAEREAERALAFVTSPVLERFHQPAAPHLALARIRRAQGRLADALEHAQRALTIAQFGVEPGLEVLVHAELARLHHAQGDGEKARSALRAAEHGLHEEATDHQRETVRLVRNEIRFVDGSAGLPVAVSDREMAVLRLLPHGLTRREIGEQLYVSENTIKTHMTSLRHKLGVTGRSEDIVARARELGLLDRG